MAKARQAGEVAVAFERLQYLEMKRQMANTIFTKDVEAKKGIFNALGYECKEVEKSDGTKKMVMYYAGYKKSLMDIYKDEFLELCDKLEYFYKTINDLRGQRLRFICELRYIEGLPWKEVAERVGISESSCYAYRKIVVKHLKESGCSWCLGEDLLLT